MKKQILFWLLVLMLPIEVFSQGYNHEWLIGYYPVTYPKTRMYFDSSNYVLQTEYRKMMFQGTEGNICDNNGNFLMSSNGVWIANANNDTMMNGSGLNPGPFISGPVEPDGLLLPFANIILPFPGDSSRYTLFHHSADFDGQKYPAFQLFRTEIDIMLDNGLGGVT